jgi:hypothetical protein
VLGRRGNLSARCAPTHVRQDKLLGHFGTLPYLVMSLIKGSQFWVRWLTEGGAASEVRLSSVRQESKLLLQRIKLLCTVGGLTVAIKINAPSAC